MGETGPISVMAEKISSEIFSIFGWEQVGPINQNWTCINKGDHQTGAGTHPSDVVLTYQDATDDDQVYFNVDLKSFSKKTISKPKLSIALADLAKSTSCALYCDEWVQRYCKTEENRRIHGLLFIYNHDNEYDGDFSSLLDKIEFDRVLLHPNQRVYVFSPEDILTYFSIARDIDVSFKDGGYAYLYPDMLIFNKAREKWLKTATVEALLNPWLVVKGKAKSADQINVYYKGNGKTVDELKFLIDFLFRCELVDAVDISVRLPYPSTDAYGNFEKAKKEYAAHFYNLKEFQNRVDRIKYYPMTNTIKQFSTEIIGMEGR